MKHEKTWYFSLTPKGGNAYHASHKRRNFTDSMINIGETADCEIRYENGAFQPEYYATIIRNEDQQSWRIVRRSRHIGITIVGHGMIGYAHQLRDGDIIQFEGQPMTLLFHAHYDDKSQDTAGMHRVWPWAAIICCLFAAACLTSLFTPKTPIGIDDVAPLEASLFMVKVDSVQQILLASNEEKLLRPTISLSDETPTGTAFLTEDSILVTARHCVEYWIGTALKLSTKVSDLADDDIVRWAIEVESFNQTLHRDSTMRLRVFFSMYDFMGEKRYSFSSTDRCIHFNPDKDGLFLLADFNNNYYWRTIRPYFKDINMEMGDILWIDGLPEKGNIRMACPTDLEKMKKGTPLMIGGYPITGIGERRAIFTTGINSQDADFASQNLVFEANINHGFSGGPVLIKNQRGIIAAGVVSRVDSLSGGLYKRAVPITEIRNITGGTNEK